MKNLKEVLFVILVILPLVAFAHGEEVLISVFIEMGLFITILTILWALKWKIVGKLLLFTIYILSTFLSFYLISGISYTNNMGLINLIIVIVPSLIVYLSYSKLKNKFTK